MQYCNLFDYSLIVGYLGCLQCLSQTFYLEKFQTSGKVIRTVNTHVQHLDSPVTLLYLLLPPSIHPYSYLLPSLSVYTFFAEPS